MGIHAYDELYLPGAQNILGHAVDFAVMTMEIEPKVFDGTLRVSKATKQFAQGNPRYVAGMNGCELAAEPGVPLRQIQLFEQGHRDINKTAAITLHKLAKALYCRMEDLLEPEYDRNLQLYQPIALTSTSLILQ